MKHDISMATKLITAMDKKHHLWETPAKLEDKTKDETKNKEDPKEDVKAVTITEKDAENSVEDVGVIKNPLLANIHDFLGSLFFCFYCNLQFFGNIQFNFNICLFFIVILQNCIFYFKHIVKSTFNAILSCRTAP